MAVSRRELVNGRRSGSPWGRWKTRAACSPPPVQLTLLQCLRSAQGCAWVLRFCLRNDSAMPAGIATSGRRGLRAPFLRFVRCGHAGGLAPSQPREQASGRAFPGAVAAAPLRLGHSREYPVDVHTAAPVGGLIAGPAGDAMAHVTPSAGTISSLLYAGGYIDEMGLQATRLPVVAGDGHRTPPGRFAARCGFRSPILTVSPVLDRLR
jgi:hypothetical protein